MVVFTEWHRAALEQKSSSGLPMSGEDTGLGASAPPLAGYLGKVQERAASLEYCPWCTSKGLTCALRSYRINFHETIILCTNPQCLFPLVSRPLEDVLASLAPVAPTVGSKRKSTLPLEREELTEPSPKCLKSNSGGRIGLQSEPGITVTNGQHAAAEADGEKVNGYHGDADGLFEETTGQKCLQDEVVAMERELEKSACSDAVACMLRLASSGNLQSSSEGEAPVLTDTESRQLKSPPEAPSGPCRQDSNQWCRTNGNVYPNETSPPSPQHTETEQKIRTADITAQNTAEMKVEPGVLSSTAGSEQLVSAPHQLFWRNSDSLCWLDSMLVVLVNCRSLRKSKPSVEPQQSSVWRLITAYDAVCAAVQAHQQTGRDGVVTVPNHVLQKASADLQNLRMSIFKLLQPKLHCQLGERETPVFAVPLLLSTDSWAEPLFQLTFLWEFTCSGCKIATKQRVTKALPTFTNIVPDWRPLQAVHFAPCNACQKQNERRSMILETVPPVFALHFVEGLPDSDVGIYSFNFKGKHYSVSSVIQYDAQLKHFVTWIHKPDGSWLEFDDLKHPDCPSHPKLPVPAQDIHVVFWEVEEGKGPRACSPSSTSAGSPPSKTETNHISSENDCVADEPLAGSPDQSFLASQNDTDIVCALTASDDDSNATDTTITAGIDTSIGSTTLLDTFEGLSHNDIITLTLVEIKEEANVQPSNDHRQTPDLSLTNKEEIKGSSAAPDSSSMVTADEMPHGPAVELALTSNSSDPETADDLSSDPSYMPVSGRGRGRGRPRSKTVGRKKAKKEPVVGTASLTSTPASAKGGKIICGRKKAKKEPMVETASLTSTPASAKDAKIICGRKKAKKEPVVETASLTSTPASAKDAKIICGRKKAKKEPVVETASLTSTPASAKGANIICDKPVGAAAQDDAPPPPPPPPVETTQQTSPVSSTNTSPPSTTPDLNARWSYLLSKHPLSQVNMSLARIASTRAPVSVREAKPAVPNHSTPNPLRRAQIPTGVLPKPQLIRREEIESLPIKAAEMFDAFGAKTSASGPPHAQIPSPAAVAQLNCKSKVTEPITSVNQKSLMNTSVVSNKSFLTPGLPEISSSNKHSVHSSEVPPDLSVTEALRYKLLKKLKAKKKKLAKLNQLLGQQGGAGGEFSLTPDSTALSSPVTSSAYGGSTCDEFLSDLLSPATTASNLSPDSTDFLEMLTSRQDGVHNSDQRASAVGAAPQANGTLTTNTDDFLEELMSQAVTQQQTQMEAEALSALELFF